MKKVVKGLAFIAISAAAPAIAQSQAQPAQPQQQQAAKKAAPDDMICEKQIDLGSRIATHKICRTRSQWAETLRDSRSDVERAQAQRAMRGN